MLVRACTRGRGEKEQHGGTGEERRRALHDQEPAPATDARHAAQALHQRPRAERAQRIPDEAQTLQRGSRGGHSAGGEALGEIEDGTRQVAGLKDTEQHPGRAELR